LRNYNKLSQLNWEKGCSLEPVGGMMQMTDDVVPAEVPPHWGVLRRRRQRWHGRQGPRARGERHGRARGHADRTLRRPDRSSGSFLHGDATGATRLMAKVFAGINYRVK